MSKLHIHARQKGKFGLLILKAQQLLFWTKSYSDEELNIFAKGWVEHIPDVQFYHLWRHDLDPVSLSVGQ